jgi:hydrogenase expression/formation protein HypD
MKYIDEFRTGALVQKISAKIVSEVSLQRDYHFMEFCGGHTYAISRFGIIDLLPDNVHMIHGTGCPVCVLPIGRVENQCAHTALASTRHSINYATDPTGSL